MAATPFPVVWQNVPARYAHAVSRRQEFIADELAARTVGAKPPADGLRIVHGTGLAQHSTHMWRNSNAQRRCSMRGFRPPLVEGFEKFIQANHIVDAVNKHVDEQLKTGKSNPYDTHPPSSKTCFAAVANFAGGRNPTERSTRAFDLLVV